jgi:TetR/AcrR family transcriptional regulator, ethionamide resistance regulator
MGRWVGVGLPRRDMPQPGRAEQPEQPGRPGRPGRADGRDVRALILDATERLLAGQRFESLSVADILKAAAVSRGSFYFYFPNKHAVLAELVRRAVGGARGAAGVWTADESDSPGAALRQGTREGARLWRAHAPVLRAIVENWQSDPVLAGLWAEMIDGFATVATERILTDRAAGRAPARDDDPRALATALCWMSERAYYLAAIGHPAFTDEGRLVDALTEVWTSAVYGVLAPGPGRSTS